MNSETPKACPGHLNLSDPVKLFMFFDNVIILRMIIKQISKNTLMSRNKQSAFTIVELLVVIVIIGILATIMFLAYIGISQKAVDGSLQSDLDNISKTLEMDKVANNDVYPSTKDSANNNNGLKSSQDTILDYFYNSADNSYCLTATKNGRSYYINSLNREPTQGTCPVKEESVANAFSKTWGGATNDYGISIINTNDGGYAIAGETNSFGNGMQAQIIKYSADGSFEWNKTWGGGGNDSANSIIQTSDGGYAIIGTTDSFGSYSEVFIAKFTNNGSFSWNKTWGGANYDYGKSIIQTTDGGYAITGETTSFGNSVQAFLAKFTSDGSLSWSKTWGGSTFEWGMSIVQSNDNGYAIVGTTNSFSGNYRAFLAKFTADGNLSWNKIWGDNLDLRESGYSVVKTSDGGYAVTGQTYVMAPSSDAFLARFTSEGILLWNKTWGDPSLDDEAYSIAKTNDNGYVVSGKFTGSEGMNLGAFLTKYSAEGNLLWNKTWGKDIQYVGGSSVSQANDGSLAITGWVNGLGSIGADLLFIKYSADGSSTGCPSYICQSPVVVASSYSTTTINPPATVASQTANINDPTATITTPVASETVIAPTIPEPTMTTTFSAQELYIAYPGASQTACKEWTVPNGKQIKGFKASQATESRYDYFIVSLDDVEVYKMSGTVTDKYIDLSSTPGAKLKACVTADSSAQNGFGGEVTGVLYN